MEYHIGSAPAPSLPLPADHPCGHSAAELRSMSIVALAEHARAERARFSTQQEPDTRYMYEIFRRAMAERDDMAWECVYAAYETMVRGWIQHSAAFLFCGETAEALINTAFTRFWEAVMRAGFASFPTLPALLGYLRRCATGAVIDAARSQQRIALFGHGELEEPVGEDEQERVINRADWAQLWQVVDAELQNEAERVVITSTFVLGMKPREIFEQHPALFEDVSRVYRHKRNVLERLARVEALRALAGEG
jgi:DNA-directed RNA polymerase specialized sigma24 family protein